LSHTRRIDPMIVAAFAEKRDEISLLKKDLSFAQDEIAAIQFTPFSLAGFSKIFLSSLAPLYHARYRPERLHTLNSSCFR
jgi:hypothetical protein